MRGPSSRNTLCRRPGVYGEFTPRAVGGGHTGGAAPCPIKLKCFIPAKSYIAKEQKSKRAKVSSINNGQRYGYSSSCGCARCSCGGGCGG